MGKHPIGRLAPHGHLNATIDPAIIESWWGEVPQANIAIATGPGRRVVLDIDAHRGGLTALEALEQQHGPLPRTYTVRTPRGGRHVIFAQGEAAIRCKTDMWPGIDIKAQGGYVIAPPSRTEWGAYEVVDDVERADLPQWLEAILPGGRPAPVKASPATTHWVHEALQGVPDGRRNDTCAKLAGYFCNRGVDPSVVEGLLLDFAARCQPPLDPEKARATARSIMSGAGALADDDGAPLGEDAHTWAWRVSSAPSVGYHIPSLVRHASSLLLHGQPRSAKTWVLMELALSLTTGVPAFHLPAFTPNRAVRVFYVTEEDPASEFFERFVGLLFGHGLRWPSPALTLAVRKGIWLDDPRHQARLIEEIRERGDEIVIFEPLRSLSACVDQGPAEFQPLGRFFRRVMQETGCAVWAGHHDTKPINGRMEQRARPQRASGGGVFAFFDSPIHVEALGTDPLRVLVSPTAFKFGATPQPFTVTLDVVGGHYKLVGEPLPPAAAGGQSITAEILDFVRTNPGQSGTKIAKALRRNKATILSSLQALCAAGEVYEDGRGRSRSYYDARIRSSQS